MRRTHAATDNPLSPHNQLWWDRISDRAGASTTRAGADPCLAGEFTLPDGTPVKPAFQLLRERVEEYTPEWAAEITGIPAATIRRLAHEMGVTARDQKIELPIPWTDSWGREHDDGAPAIRSRSTRCAGSPRIRTASRRSARSRS